MLVKWSAEDSRFLVTVPQMPEYMTDGRTYEEAVINASIIIKCLNEEQWFIPSKIGFPEEKIDDVEIEDDYPWFELNVWDFKDSTKPPQIDKSPEEVVDLFLAAKGHWEE